MNEIGMRLACGWGRSRSPLHGWRRTECVSQEVLGVWVIGAFRWKMTYLAHDGQFHPVFLLGLWKWGVSPFPTNLVMFLHQGMRAWGSLKPFPRVVHLVW